MTFSIVPQSCRICFQSGVKLRSLYFMSDDDDEPPSRLLEDLTGIILEDFGTYPELPKKICKTCDLSLNMAYEFRMKALKSNDAIVNFVRANNYKKRFKNFVYIKEETSNQSIDGECFEEITELSPGDDDDDDDDDDDQEDKHNKRKKSQSSEANETKIEDEDENANENEEKFNENEENKDEEDKNKMKSQEQTLCEEMDLSEDNILEIGEEYLDESIETAEDLEEDFLIGIEFNAMQTLEKEPVKKEPEKAKSTIKVIDLDQFIEEFDQLSEKRDKTVTHICDVCGNTFTNRARMMEHRKRHFPNKNFSCEICGETFNMQEKLRKHMFQHSGQKPFKCSFCSRSFFYKSVKNNHEAVHKGIKPFICEVCNAAFAYQHSLAKHKLIHDDIKLYHCLYCNKDFRLQHHFKQHLETRRHQNHVRTAKLEKHNLELADEDVSQTGGA